MTNEDAKKLVALIHEREVMGCYECGGIGPADFGRVFPDIGWDVLFYPKACRSCLRHGPMTSLGLCRECYLKQAGDDAGVMYMCSLSVNTTYKG